MDRAGEGRKALYNGTVRLYRSDAAWILVIALFFVTCIELFYRMIVRFNGVYPSDMHYYAITAVEKEHLDPRLIDIISRGLYSINNNTMEFNIFLATLIPLIIVANFFAIRFFVSDDLMMQKVPRYTIQAASVLALFTGPVFIPILHEYYYMHSFAAFAWHNPKQHAMTLLSLVGTICFLKMFIVYKEQQTISLKYWISSTLALFLSATAKPSFVIEFVPSVIVLFLIELFSGEKKNLVSRFKSLFIMGCTLLPAGLYIIWLSTVDFGDTNGMEGAIEVVFGLSQALSHKNVLHIFVFGMPFTITVLIANYKRIRDSKYFMAFMIFVWGVAQWLFFGEAGERAKHGNFDWGRMYGTYFLALVALSLLIENIYYPNSVFPNSKRARKIYIIVAIVLLTLSVLSQFTYFGYVLSGRKYMR